jgi:hypothetical protein
MFPTTDDEIRAGMAREKSAKVKIHKREADIS